MLNKRRQIFLKVTEIFLKSLTIIWIYTPIIAGIFIQMVWYVPIAFTTWWLFSFLGNPNWVLLVFIFRSKALLIIIIIFEFIIFFLGLLLLIWGVLVLAQVRRHKQGLAIKGPYRFVRHPQLLGLIMITLAISLYIPWIDEEYIRVGEILSWSLFTMILFIQSDFEERKLRKLFGEEYLEYRSKTGAFFPRILRKKKERKSMDEIRYWKRYLFVAFGYLCFVSFIRLLVYVLGLPEKPYVGVWFDTLPRYSGFFTIILLVFMIFIVIIRKYRKKTFHLEKEKEDF